MKSEKKIWPQTLMVFGAVTLSVLGVLYFFTPQLFSSTVDSMPLPSRTFEHENVPVQAQSMNRAFAVYNTDVGDDKRAWDDVRYAQSISSMSVEDMPRDSVFIPARGIFSMIRGSDDFTASRYKGLPTLDIPHNAHRSVWYSAGGSLGPSSKGTAMVASHIAHKQVSKGAFYDLHKVQPGDEVWTRDKTGLYQRWAIEGLVVYSHREFPQEYFSATGQRRLVLVTCGGRLNKRTGYYRDNVIAIARPIEQ